jgi:DNA-binding PadR family transcriptional regulator
MGNRLRKYYSLTEKGKAVVNPAIEEVMDFQSTLALLFGKSKTSLS